MTFKKIKEHIVKLSNFPFQLLVESAVRVWVKRYFLSAFLMLLSSYLLTVFGNLEIGLKTVPILS